MPASPSPSLLQAVQSVCDTMDGGHVSQSGPLVRVINCPVWSARATALLRVQRPTALIAVETSVASLSGFAILVSEPPPPMHQVPRFLMLLITVFGVLVGQSLIARAVSSDDYTCGANRTFATTTVDWASAAIGRLIHGDPP
jgi:hypothetical protein